MSNLSCLVYTSYRKPICDDKEIEKILSACKNNNKPKGITGVLLYSDNRFLQYLEGNEHDIQSLYLKIKEDPRHAAVTQRDFKPITQRLFPSWEMAHKDISDKNLSYDTVSTHEHKQLLEKLINDDLDFRNEGIKVLQLFFKVS